MSEELENSLQQAIETYLGQRLRAIEEQISQLQTEFGEALTRLRESAASESLSGTALSASIFAHFQAARAQQLTGAAECVPISSNLRMSDFCFSSAANNGHTFAILSRFT